MMIVSSSSIESRPMLLNQRYLKEPAMAKFGRGRRGFVVTVSNPSLLLLTLVPLLAFAGVVWIVVVMVVLLPSANTVGFSTHVR